MGLAAVARNAAEGAVAAAARRAARPGTDLAAESDRLVEVLSATVPGARDTIAVQVRRTAAAGSAEAGFRWEPPGPLWMRLDIRVAAEAPLVQPP